MVTHAHVPRHGGAPQISGSSYNTTAMGSGGGSGGGGAAVASSGSSASSMWGRLGGAVFGVAGSVTSRVGGVAGSVTSRVGGVAESVKTSAFERVDAVKQRAAESVDAVKVRAAEKVAGLRGPNRPASVDEPVSAAVLTASYPSSAPQKKADEDAATAAAAEAARAAATVTASYPTHSPAREKPETLYPTVGPVRSEAERLEMLYPTAGTAAGSEERMMTLLMELPDVNRVPPTLVMPPEGCTEDNMVFASSEPVRVLGLEFTNEGTVVDPPAPQFVRAVELLYADKYELCDNDRAAVFESTDGSSLWLTVRPRAPPPRSLSPSHPSLTSKLDGYARA
jgi:uncharacterized protein YjbJ (UPF0337 family)